MLLVPGGRQPGCSVRAGPVDGLSVPESAGTGRFVPGRRADAAAEPLTEDTSAHVRDIGRQGRARDRPAAPAAP